MAMPDAVTALLKLQSAPHEKLTQMIYNVGAFNPSALEVFAIIQKAFTNPSINFTSDYRRQAIIDSWPADVDDSAARNDWGWSPAYDLERAFADYLIPAVRKRYTGKS
jgi:nucleoside-diphosphate-sugar epimerase